MPTGNTTARRDGKRQQRKSHKKSRAGCANCRFRRIKCDEGKPSCQKCDTYMVPCSYERAAQNFNVIGEDISEGFVLEPARNHSSQQSRWTPVSTCDPTIVVSSNCSHDVILRFQQRTALTMGSEHTVHVYAKVVPRLAMQHEFLLHTILAITIGHDRALVGTARPVPVESYHLSQAAALFNQKLSSTIAVDDRDALWAAAVYLCAMAIFNVGTSDPQEAWPLTLSCTNDLEWLQMQAGLQVVWKLAHIYRKDGMFAYVEDKSKVNCVYPEAPQPGIIGLPTVLVKLCNLNETTTASNPYHTAVRYLTWLLPICGNSVNILSFLVFAGGMTKKFRTLLRQKDARALLLLAIWYSKLFHSTWWMSPRAIIECTAICRYLSRNSCANTTFDQVLNLVGLACAHLDSEAVTSLLSDTVAADTYSTISKRHLPMLNGPTSTKVDMSWIDVR